MKLAIPEWRGRVSPVFDVARNLLLVEVQDGSEQGRRRVHLAERETGPRANCVVGLGVDVLVCGAISWPLEMLLGAAGIRVISQTCGDVEQVLSAFIADGLNPNAFLMPGCCRRRQQFHAQRWGGGRPGPGRGPRQERTGKGGQGDAGR